MSRVIEYRAWHKAEKVMGTVEVLTIGQGAFVTGVKPESEGQTLDFDEFRMMTVPATHGRFCKLEEIELLQYTCRGDIDGNKVFEGDLLKFPGDIDGIYSVDWLNEEGEWGLMFEYKDHKIQMGRIGMVKLMQVVGNIYETKGGTDAEITNQQA